MYQIQESTEAIHAGDSSSGRNVQQEVCRIFQCLRGMQEKRGLHTTESLLRGAMYMWKVSPSHSFDMCLHHYQSSSHASHPSIVQGVVQVLKSESQISRRQSAWLDMASHNLRGMLSLGKRRGGSPALMLLNSFSLLNLSFIDLFAVSDWETGFPVISSRTKHGPHRGNNLRKTRMGFWMLFLTGNKRRH